MMCSAGHLILMSWIFLYQTTDLQTITEHKYYISFKKYILLFHLLLYLATSFHQITYGSTLVEKYSTSNPISSMVFFFAERVWRCFLKFLEFLVDALKEASLFLFIGPSASQTGSYQRLAPVFHDEHQNTTYNIGVQNCKGFLSILFPYTFCFVCPIMCLYKFCLKFLDFLMTVSMDQKTQLPYLSFEEKETCHNLSSSYPLFLPCLWTYDSFLSLGAN